MEEIKTTETAAEATTETAAAPKTEKTKKPRRIKESREEMQKRHAEELKALKKQEADDRKKEEKKLLASVAKTIRAIHKDWTVEQIKEHYENILKAQKPAEKTEKTEAE